MIGIGVRPPVAGTKLLLPQLAIVFEVTPLTVVPEGIPLDGPNAGLEFC